MNGKVYTKLQKRLFLFKRFLFYKPTLDVKIRMVLADYFILSQLRAFLFNWNPHQYHQKITKIYHEIMKVILGLRKSTPIPTRYSLLGWLSIKDQIFVQYFKLLSTLAGSNIKAGFGIYKKERLPNIISQAIDTKIPTISHQ